MAEDIYSTGLERKISLDELHERVARRMASMPTWMKGSPVNYRTLEPGDE